MGRQADEGWFQYVVMGTSWSRDPHGFQQTDGICDDVLDVAEGIASETVIELTQEEKGIRERYGSDKKMYTWERNRKMWHIR